MSNCVPRSSLCRRLYPDMAFFQRPTEYPCLLILDPQNEYETLRRRVEQTTLKAQTVDRNRSGVTNVSFRESMRARSLSLSPMVCWQVRAMPDNWHPGIVGI